ncbi:hypothetical protein PITCH_A1920092 [uncultured Desulfobacterium sp.]|uniref:Uncharacterized protein n=1 Tax=uncultured Desulfobacterium sp. TaxID=201089 RepID=A0A445MWD9_9BACT|nr:hypothetical protein PITCH_A1920092 [uncultured Desulfobacterium sp.]
MFLQLKIVKECYSERLAAVLKLNNPKKSC